MTKKWGPPTWYFIHSFLALMTNDCYQKNIQLIINLLTAILTNLPCQDCTNHAKAYIKVNPLHKNLQPTIRHMQYYFYNFHNNVNKRLRKPVFENVELYQTAKLSLMFRNFQNVFKTSHGMDFSNGLSRQNIIHELRNFINMNNMCFKWY